MYLFLSSLIDIFFLQKTSDVFRLESTWYTEYKLCTSRPFFLFTPIIQWKIEISFNLMHCYQVNAWLGHLFQVKIDLVCGSIGDIACTCVPVNLYLFIQKYIFGQCSSSVYNNAHVIIIQCQQQTLWGLKWGWNPWSSVPHILTILRVSTCSGCIV